MVYTYVFGSYSCLLLKSGDVQLRMDARKRNKSPRASARFSPPHVSTSVEYVSTSDPIQSSIPRNIHVQSLFSLIGKCLRARSSNAVGTHPGRPRQLSWPFASGAYFLLNTPSSLFLQFLFSKSYLSQTSADHSLPLAHKRDRLKAFTSPALPIAFLGSISKLASSSGSQLWICWLSTLAMSYLQIAALPLLLSSRTHTYGKYHTSAPSLCFPSICLS
jgi:hypothetical protein